MNPTAIVVGSGPSGISMAHELRKAGIPPFDIYKAAAKPGDVWHQNTYSRCGCDVPSHLYLFSFNKNPDWISYFQQLGIRAHIHVLIRCISTKWDDGRRKWVVSFRNKRTNIKFTREADIFISCVGGAISVPKDCTSLRASFGTRRSGITTMTCGKRIAVLGNGCSADQFVPWLVKQGAQVTQYAPLQQWYHERPNHRFTAMQRFLFRYVPSRLTLYRSRIFVKTDSLLPVKVPGLNPGPSIAFALPLTLLTTYLAMPKVQKVRSRIEKESMAYMQRTAPAKYHKLLTPNYPLKCKRRVFLRTERISRIKGPTVTKADFNAIILAMGYKVQEFPPMEIKGTNGKLLLQRLKETCGAQAYRSTFVSGFPSFAIIFGPNSFPAHNSVMYTSEVQC
ncbi:hypothetical protein JCM3770_003862 [Rhodotorula araucariae]